MLADSKLNRTPEFLWPMSPPLDELFSKMEWYFWSKFCCASRSILVFYGKMFAQCCRSFYSRKVFCFLDRSTEFLGLISPFGLIPLVFVRSENVVFLILKRPKNKEFLVGLKKQWLIPPCYRPIRNRGIIKSNLTNISSLNWINLYHFVPFRYDYSWFSFYCISANS